MEITDNNIHKFLLICLFIAGMTMLISGFYVYKQFRQCEAAINEYNETVKVTRWKQLKIQTS